MTNRRRGLPVTLVGGLAILLLFVLAGCGTDEPLTTISPKSNVGEDVQGLYKLIFWMAVFVFVAVEGVLVYATLRYRRRPGDGMPRQSHGHRTLEVVWTFAPVIVLLVIVIPTWQVIFKTANTPEDALQIEVTGYQWWWEVRYPELGVVTANEIHVPVGRPIGISLMSDDVIHSFWVPQLTGKKDMVPGRVNSLWFTPTVTGLFQGQCAELCGESHANMRFQVEVQDQAAFDQWVEAQTRAPAAPEGLAATGADLFISKGCLACHTIEGTVAAGTIGPDLTHVGSRKTLAGGILDMEDLERWLQNPPGEKPGSKMPNLNLQQDEITALAAYLRSLK